MWTEAEKELWKKFCRFYKVVDSTLPLETSFGDGSREEILAILSKLQEIFAGSLDPNFSADGKQAQLTKDALRGLFIYVFNAYLSETDIKEAWHQLYEGLRAIRPGNFFSQLAFLCKQDDKAEDFFFNELPKITKKPEDLAKQYFMDPITTAFKRKFEIWKDGGTLTQLKQIEKFLRFITRSFHMSNIPPSIYKSDIAFKAYQKLVSAKESRAVGLFLETKSIKFENFATKKLKKEVKKYFKEVKHLLKDGLFPRKRLELLGLQDCSYSLFHKKFNKSNSDDNYERVVRSLSFLLEKDILAGKVTNISAAKKFFEDFKKERWEIFCKNNPGLEVWSSGTLEHIIKQIITRSFDEEYQNTGLMAEDKSILHHTTFDCNLL